MEFSRVVGLKLYGLVHRTLSGAPFFSTLKVLLRFFIESLTLFLSWFVLNLMHLLIHEF
jgi:hypothetical protein